MNLTVRYYKEKLKKFRQSDAWDRLQKMWTVDLALFALLGLVCFGANRADTAAAIGDNAPVLMWTWIAVAFAAGVCGGLLIHRRTVLTADYKKLAWVMGISLVCYDAVWVALGWLAGLISISAKFTPIIL